jgi:hypothetical protein
MTAVLPFRVSKYNTARPHQRSYGDLSRVVAKHIEADPCICVEHVRDGKALTAKGAALLRKFRERVS